MACGGLKAVESTLQTIRNKNSTQRILNLALNMMGFSKKFSWGDSEKIKIKIGIHYGPVIAGVIGYHKPQFSLIGDTVNTTSRVCSTGDESTITMSKEAYDKILGTYKGLEFIERRVEAKGKGEIITYQIKKKRKTENNGHSTIISPILMAKFNEKFQSSNKEKSTDNQELINIAKNIRTKIKKTTMMMGIGRNVVLTNFKHSTQDLLNRSPNNKSPKNFHRLISANNYNFKQKIEFLQDHNEISSAGKKNYDLNVPNALDDISEGTHAKNLNGDALSFNRMNSDNRGYFIDEFTNTNEKKQTGKDSFLKLNSGISRSEQGHGGLNILHYIESEHFKALLNTNEVALDHIEKNEQYPGEHNVAATDTRKSGTNLPLATNDDDFFDKLKVKENTLEILNFQEFWLTLKGSDPTVVQEFSEKRKEVNFNENMASMIIFTLAFLVNTFLSIFKKNYLENFEIFISNRSFINVLNFLVLFIFQRFHSNTVLMRKWLLFLNFATATELLFEYVITDYFALENTLELILFVLLCINNSYINFLDNVILLSYINIFLFMHSIKQAEIEIFINIILTNFCLVMILNNLRVKTLNSYKNFNTLRINLAKKNQQNNLIVNLLPTHILEKFLRNPNQKLNLTDEFEDVTILFADIAGFTKYSSTVSPSQVVSVLQDLFTEFDKLCLDNCVYKLYTIGDCYVVLGLIDAEERDVEREALNVVNMGFQMIEKIKEVKKRVSFHDINMRIGIHTV